MGELTSELSKLPLDEAELFEKYLGNFYLLINQGHEPKLLQNR